MKATKTHAIGKFLNIAIFTVTVLLLPAALRAQTQDFWQPVTGDFNVASNWTLNTVPISGYAANNDNGSNNVGIISANDPTFTFNGFRDGVSASGAFLQTGSTVTLGVTQGGWLRMGLNANSVGYYTIMSNAILNTPDGVTCGESGTGYLNVYGGTINAGNAKNFIVNSNGQGGTLTQTNGTVVVTGQVWIGQQTPNGYFNMSGGTFSVTNWFVLGRAGGTGTLTMTGGTLNAGGSGGYLDVGTGFGGASTGVINQTGGTINVVGNGLFACPETSPGKGTYNLSSNGTLHCNSWITIGRGGVGILNMSGGSIIKTDTTTHFDVGAGGSSSGSGTGTINQTGGLITNTTSDFWLGEVANGTWNCSGGTNYLRNLVISQGSGLNSTMNLDGGFMSVASIYSAQPLSSFSTLELNGGTIQATASTPNFIYNLSTISLQSGGITLDTQGYNVTIPAAIGDGGGGTLVKIGSGTLTLSGANSYAGSTVVSNGTLSTTTASSGGGAYTVNDGATLDVAVASAGQSLAAANLTLGSATGATLQIDLGSTGNPATAPITVGGALTANGTVNINVTDSTPAVGQYKLISYGTLAPGGTIQLGTLSPGMAATLVNDTASNSIDLNVTSAGAPYWNGNVTGGVWDVTNTANWIDLATAASETFRNSEPVLFNDNATGTTTVNVSTTVQPGSVTVNNNNLPYTFTGTGPIAGTTGLVMEGSNTLTISMSGNTYTGPTTIAGGVLSVASLANGGSASAIGASSSSPTNLVLAGGTLSYTGAAASINRGYSDTDTNGAVDIDAESALSLGGSVTAGFGSGFTKGGPAQLTYTGAGTNVLSDTLGYTVAQGTVLFSGPAGGQTNNVVGPLSVGVGGSTNAALAVTNNSTLNLTTSGNLIVANGNTTNSAATLTLEGGNINLANPYQVWVGQGSNGVGALNISAGTMNVNNWLAVGRANGTGTMTLSGSAILNIGNAGAFDIGTSAGIAGRVGTGTFTQTGGSLSNNCPTWLGEGATGEPAQGTWNMSGGTAMLVGAVGQNAPAALMLGQSGIGTNTVNLSGTAAITCGNYVSIGHLAGVTGILNIGDPGQPGGTFTMSGGQDFNVGDSGAGILNMVAGGGGQLTVRGTMYLTRSGTASGTVNLNGGTLIVSFINNGFGFGNNTSTNPQSFNFNGGTLQANVSSAFFIQPYVTTVVQSNGAFINDAGYTVSINSVLADGGGGGGLTKTGSGRLYLTGANTYTGTTLVSNGALGVGPAGAIAGPVVVSSGAVLLGDIGTIGTCFINNTLTLNPGSTTAMALTPASNDQIAGLTGVTYGGALVITNTSTNALVVGDIYKLFNCAVPGASNFSSVTIVPSGAGTFNPTNGTLTIIPSAPPAPPVMNAPSLVNGNVVVTGTGTAGNSYTLLSTTNLTIPLANWVTNASGVFDGSGAFTNAIPVTNGPALFFQLRTP
jgi:autotransporter-associated beta strand protein